VEAYLEQLEKVPTPIKSTILFVSENLKKLENPISHIIESTQPVQSVEIEDIVKNPEKYIGKEVKVKGKMEFIIWLIPQSKLSSYFLEDEQGYRLLLAEPLPYGGARSYHTGAIYEAKGKIIQVEIEGLGGVPKKYLAMVCEELVKIG